jgi:hypothetical protein
VLQEQSAVASNMRNTFCLRLKTVTISTDASSNFIPENGAVKVRKPPQEDVPKCHLFTYD